MADYCTQAEVIRNLKEITVDTSSLTAMNELGQEYVTMVNGNYF